MLQQQKEHIQEKAYQCIWNNYIISQGHRERGEGVARVAPANTPLGKGEGVDKENNKWQKERKARSQNSDVPHTNSFRYFFL